MSRAGRNIGVVLTLAMFVFSVWMYMRTGDWVALVFAAGSFGYAAFFFRVKTGNQS